jgi:hypothetical protein
MVIVVKWLEQITSIGMGIEALWSLEFVSTEDSYGAGVVIFETNKIFGGDSLYYYLGNYETKMVY